MVLTWSSGAAGAQVPYKHKVGGSNPSATTIEKRESPISNGVFLFYGSLWTDSFLAELGRRVSGEARRGVSSRVFLGRFWQADSRPGWVLGR